jgi:tetratricopeptide (TPR) repeat protein
MTAHQRLWPLGLGVLLLSLASPGHATDQQQLMRLLESRSCQGCKLQDADLVQADLRDARLKGALLERANLSGSRLDGADLRGANLSFTSLAGASLRGADLRGSDLNGTDLRQADLSGALLDPGSLSRTHWDQASGIDPNQQSYAELHNAGVNAAQQGRYPEAEKFFGEAIRKQPDAAISWVARGISRKALGQAQSAANDLLHASELYRLMGDTTQADELAKAGSELNNPDGKNRRTGNGAGMTLAAGAAAAFQALAPLALKAFIPIGL